MHERHTFAALVGALTLFSACAHSPAPSPGPAPAPTPPPAPAPASAPLDAAAAPPDAGASPAVAVPDGCTEDGARAIFALRGDDPWLLRCTTLGAVRVFTAWHAAPANADAAPATLRIATVEGGRVTWQSTETTHDTLAAERWATTAAQVVQGTPGGLRVGLVGTDGEDYQTSIEHALVFRTRPTGGYDRVWEGDGNRDERSMDACLVALTRRISFADANTLELTQEGVANFQSQNLARGVLQRLRAGCRNPVPRTERIPLQR